MKTKHFIGAIALLIQFVSFNVSAQPAQQDEQKYNDLAKRLVTECASVKEGEIVMITGSVTDNRFLEDIAVEVRKQGAFPLLRYGSDRLARLMYTEVPVKYDSQLSELNLKLFDMINTVISLEINVNPGNLSDIPPERIVERNKEVNQINQMIIQKNIKLVTLGNGLYPTETRSKQYNLTLDELSDLFWNGLNVDYAKMQAMGNKMKSMLASAKEMHITNPNGTDLKVMIENRPVMVSDGIIPPENMDNAKVWSAVFLPAGEVFITPVPGTAEGTIVIEHDFFQDKEIIDLKMTFSKGKMVSMSAKSGLEPFKALYDAAGEGKDDFSVIDFGINPNVKVKEGSKLVNWIPAGTVSLNIGNNVWAGGDNQCPFAYTFHTTGSTVKLDGKVLVENGQLAF